MSLAIILLGLAVILVGTATISLVAMVARTRRSLFILDAKLAEHLSLDPRYAKARASTEQSVSCGQSPIQGGGW